MLADFPGSLFYSNHQQFHPFYQQRRFTFRLPFDTSFFAYNFIKILDANNSFIPAFPQLSFEHF